MYTYKDYNICGANPLLLPSLADPPFVPFFVPFTYLESLLAVTGSVHLSLRLLVNWPPPPQPIPIPSPLQIPSTQVIYAPHYDDLKNPASLVRNNTYSINVDRAPSLYIDSCLLNIWIILQLQGFYCCPTESIVVRHTITWQHFK
jgi:hypothetical protein